MSLNSFESTDNVTLGNDSFKNETSLFTFSELELVNAPT